MTKQLQTTVNEGIQANVVKADVLAVGRGAKAVKTVFAEGDRKALLEAVAQIHNELDRLNLDPSHRQEVKRHATELERSVTSKQANPKEIEGALGKFIGKLKELGVIVKEAAGLVAPIRVIAGLLHVSLSSLGVI
jgi:hypothetical protein